METSCLEAWQALDLVNVQLALDEQASQVANFREACLASRKVLAAATREFRQNGAVKRADDASPVKALVPKLLRSYQEEVDRLTQRSKFAENCFLAFYRLIREAPDPSDALSSASKRVFMAEMARKDAVEREHELEKKMLLVKMELESRPAAAEVTPENNTFMMDEEERQLVVAAVEEKWRVLLENSRVKAEEEAASASLELELAHAQTERQAESVRLLELELQRTRSESSTTRQNQVPLAQFASLESENQRLVGELLVCRQQADGKVGQLEQAKRDLAALDEQSREQMLKLQRRLDERVAQLKRANEKLAALSENAENIESNGSQQQDALATEAKCKLESNLVDARNENASLVKENERLRAVEQGLTEALKDSNVLVTRLERDIELFQTNKSHAETTTFIDTSSKADEEKSLIKAVYAQRDRLRQQLRDNERELEHAKTSVQDSRRKIQSLEEDNVQLYQRIRFLQSYKASERSTLFSSSTGKESLSLNIATNLNETPSGLGLGSGIEHKYKGLYESADSSPLRIFQTQETERLTKSMPLLERMPVTVCNAFLKRSRGRVFLSVYIVSLHLVLLVLLLENANGKCI